MNGTRKKVWGIIYVRKKGYLERVLEMVVRPSRSMVMLSLRTALNGEVVEVVVVVDGALPTQAIGAVVVVAVHGIILPAEEGATALEVSLVVTSLLLLLLVLLK